MFLKSSMVDLPKTDCIVCVYLEKAAQTEVNVGLIVGLILAVLLLSMCLLLLVYRKRKREKIEMVVCKDSALMVEDSKDMQLKEEVEEAGKDQETASDTLDENIGLSPPPKGTIAEDIIKEHDESKAEAIDDTGVKTLGEGIVLSPARKGGTKGEIAEEFDESKVVSIDATALETLEGNISLLPSAKGDIAEDAIKESDESKAEQVGTVVETVENQPLTSDMIASHAPQPSGIEQEQQPQPATGLAESGEVETQVKTGDVTEDEGEGRQTEDIEGFTHRHAVLLHPYGGTKKRKKRTKILGSKLEQSHDEEDAGQITKTSSSFIKGRKKGNQSAGIVLESSLGGEESPQFVEIASSHEKKRKKGRQSLASDLEQSRDMQDTSKTPERRPSNVKNRKKGKQSVGSVLDQHLDAIETLQFPEIPFDVTKKGKKGSIIEQSLEAEETGKSPESHLSQTKKHKKGRQSVGSVLEPSLGGGETGQFSEISSSHDKKRKGGKQSITSDLEPCQDIEETGKSPERRSSHVKKRKEGKQSIASDPEQEMQQFAEIPSGHVTKGKKGKQRVGSVIEHGLEIEEAGTSPESLPSHIKEGKKGKQSVDIYPEQRLDAAVMQQFAEIHLGHVTKGKKGKQRVVSAIEQNLGAEEGIRSAEISSDLDRKSKKKTHKKGDDFDHSKTEAVKTDDGTVKKFEAKKRHSPSVQSIEQILDSRPEHAERRKSKTNKVRADIEGQCPELNELGEKDDDKRHREREHRKKMRKDSYDHERQRLHKDGEPHHVVDGLQDEIEDKRGAGQHKDHPLHVIKHKKEKREPVLRHHEHPSRDVWQTIENHHEHNMQLKKFRKESFDHEREVLHRNDFFDEQGTEEDLIPAKKPKTKEHRQRDNSLLPEGHLEQPEKTAHKKGKEKDDTAGLSHGEKGATKHKKEKRESAHRHQEEHPSVDVWKTIEDHSEHILKLKKFRKESFDHEKEHLKRHNFAHGQGIEEHHIPATRHKMKAHRESDACDVQQGSPDKSDAKELTNHPADVTKHKKHRHREKHPSADVWQTIEDHGQHILETKEIPHVQNEST